MCHGRESCTLNCPPGAIHEKQDVMGILERGFAGTISFVQGTLNVGAAMPGPAIRQLKQWAMTDAAQKNGRPVILDAPPGTSCLVVEVIRGADFVLLVTEPTPFGLHDLQLAVEVARDEMRLPLGVVVNRDGIGDGGVDEFCAENDIPILMRIPHDRRIAEAYAEGTPLIEALPEYQNLFRDLYQSIASGTIEVKVGSRKQSRV
jgi:MinD superfamily P-loop ATPase